MADNRRRDQSRRALEAQLAQRAATEAARKRRTLIASVIGTLAVIVVVIVVIVAASGHSKKTPAAAGTSTTPTPTPTPTATHVPGSCDFTAAGTAARKVTIPAATAPTTGTVTVAVATSRGAMKFTLNRADAPCTVASFVSLVKQHYYDNTSCHRLVTVGIFVLQCGDPTGKGTGGPGYTIPDEATGSEAYPAATIAMARTSTAHSGGSQFFIVFKNSPTLQQGLGTLQYTVFGKVSSGLSVVTTVAAKGSDNSNGTGDGKPKLPITLTKLTIS